MQFASTRNRGADIVGAHPTLPQRLRPDAYGQNYDFLSANKVMILSLVANELATNAIKHAFKEDKTGTISISVTDKRDGALLLVVDDDGLPFPEIENRRSEGMGLSLVAMLLYSIGASISFPSGDQKRFEIIVPKG